MRGQGRVGLRQRERDVPPAEPARDRPGGGEREVLPAPPEVGGA